MLEGTEKTHKQRRKKQVQRALPGVEWTQQVNRRRFHGTQRWRNISLMVLFDRFEKVVFLYRMNLYELACL